MEGYPHGEMAWSYHSSHPHALQLISSTDGHHQTSCCDEPKAISLINGKRRSNPVYGCWPCNFYIHKACAELVPFIRHPSHPHHTLTLVPTPPYLQGDTTCDGCWKQVNGFLYHCTVCSFDLHTHCAFLPPTINNPSSGHPHLLSLSFSSGFSSYDCDLCRKKIAATAWFYHCQPCDFQAHVDCVDDRARRGGLPVGVAAPWPMDGQPTAPEGAADPNQGTHGNSFEELKRAYSNLNKNNHGGGVVQGSEFGRSVNDDVVEELKNVAANANAVQIAAAQCDLQINTVSAMCNLLYNVRI